MSRIGPSEIGWASLIVVLLFAAWVAAYFTMVDRTPPMSYLALVRGGTPSYRFNGRLVDADWVSALFDPIHQIDRKLRPDYWRRPRTHTSLTGGFTNRAAKPPAGGGSTTVEALVDLRGKSLKSRGTAECP